MPLIRLDPNGLSRCRDKVAESVGDPRIWHGRMPLLLAVTMARMALGLPALYSRWRLPTLVVHGDADSFTDHRYSERMFADTASTDKALRLVPGAFHETFNEADGAVLAGYVVDWLAARAAAPSIDASVDLRRDEVDEGAHLGRVGAAARIDDVERGRVDDLILGQDPP